LKIYSIKEEGKKILEKDQQLSIFLEKVVW